MRLGWLVVAIGTVFRIRQYLADRSLWRDEAALVYNILHRGYGGFSRPLSFEQGSPPGFLYAEKAVTQTFGSSELALRAIPLLAAIAALAIAFILVRRHLDQTAGLVALGLCAGSPWLVYYASEVKQYSVDVLMAELVVLAASQVWRPGYDRRSCALLALAGAVAIPCSHAATFVLVDGGAGVGLAGAAPTRHRPHPQVGGSGRRLDAGVDPDVPGVRSATRQRRLPSTVLGQRLPALAAHRPRRPQPLGHLDRRPTTAC